MDNKTTGKVQNVRENPGFILQLLRDALGTGAPPATFLGPDPNTGPGMNILRQGADAIVNAPANLLQAYQKNVGQPFNDFMFKPENPTGGAPSPASPAPGAAAPQESLGLGPVDLMTAVAALGGGGGREVSIPGGAGGQPAGPNYSEMDKWLEQARPQAEDPQRRQDFAMQMVLQGLAEGAANADTSAPGAIGQVVSKAGAGASGGRVKGEAYDMEQDRAEGKEKRDYALTRADVAGKRAQAAAARSAAAFASMRPKVIHADKDNIVMMTPDPKTGNMTIKSIPIGNSLNQADNTYKALKGLGAEDEVAKIAKYGTYQQSGNLPGYKIEMILDSVRDGSAPIIFKDLYSAHLKDVTKEHNSTGDLEKDQEDIQRQVAVRMFSDLDGNDAWIQEAAKIGNFGAINLLKDLD